MYDGKCLTVGARNNIFTAVLEPCQEGNAKQEWLFERFDPRGLDYGDFGKPTNIKKKM